MESYEPTTVSDLHRPTLLPAVFKEAGFVLLHYTAKPDSEQSFEEFAATLSDSCAVNVMQLACLDKQQLISRSVLAIKAVRFDEHVTEFSLLIEVANGHLVLEYGPAFCVQEALKASKQRLVAQFKPTVQQFQLNVVSLIRILHSSVLEYPQSVNSTKRVMRVVKTCLASSLDTSEDLP